MSDRNSRAAAGPGYTRPLSEAQKKALRLISISGDVRYRRGSTIHTNTLDSLVRLGLAEHCELPVGSGHETRAAVRLSKLAGLIRLQWAPQGPKPIEDECEECCGTGKVDQDCESCGVSLTVANWKPENEGYVCNECLAKEEM